jgi:hypothetical protein
MNIIRRLLGRQPTGTADTQSRSDADAQEPSHTDFEAESRFVEQGSRNDTRRELIRVVLRDTLRRHGIPADWLRGEMLTVASRERQTVMHLRLVMLHWDDRLLNFSHAFELSFMKELSQFESDASDWLHSISWQIGADSGCPHVEMPQPQSWTQEAQKEDPDADLREDLEKLFAIRDLERARHLANRAGDAGDDFAQTQPSQL